MAFKVKYMPLRETINLLNNELINEDIFKPTDIKNMDIYEILDRICPNRYSIRNGAIYVTGDMRWPLDYFPMPFYYVDGNFAVDNVNFKSLVGCPKIVGNSFSCSYTKIKNLEGLPQQIGGALLLNDNDLISLDGCPKNIKNMFDCSHNNLTSLKGAPVSVGGVFDCSYNKLKSLKLAPKIVGGEFNCSANLLKSLVGAPQEIKSNFDCSNNRLESLFGMPKIINGDFQCRQNLIQISVKMARSYSNIKGIVKNDAYDLNRTKRLQNESFYDSFKSSKFWDWGLGGKQKSLPKMGEETFVEVFVNPSSKEYTELKRLSVGIKGAIDKHWNLYLWRGDTLHAEVITRIKRNWRMNNDTNYWRIVLSQEPDANGFFVNPLGDKRKDLPQGEANKYKTSIMQKMKRFSYFYIDMMSSWYLDRESLVY